MKFKKPVKLSELASKIGAEVVGDGSMLVEGINEIHRIEKGELVFVDHPKYYDKALNSEATFVLINKKVEVPEGKALLIMKYPFDGFNAIIRDYFSNPMTLHKIGKKCQIDQYAFVLHHHQQDHYIWEVLEQLYTITYLQKRIMEHS